MGQDLVTELFVPREQLDLDRVELVFRSLLAAGFSYVAAAQELRGEEAGAEYDRQKALGSALRDYAAADRWWQWRVLLQGSVLGDERKLEANLAVTQAWP